MFKRLFSKLLGKPASAMSASRTIANPSVASPEAKLLALLSNEKYQFRSLDRLVKASGLGHEATVNLLRTMGARPAYRDSTQYGLVSRVGTGLRRDSRHSLDGIDVAGSALNKTYALLNDPQYKFRSFDKLKGATGLNDDDDVEQVLQSLGARESRRGGKWGLISRVGKGRSFSY